MIINLVSMKQKSNLTECNSEVIKIPNALESKSEIEEKLLNDREIINIVNIEKEQTINTQVNPNLTKLDIWK